MPRKPAKSDKPKIPKLQKHQYPTGRTVPEAARREVYAAFRAHAMGALDVLTEIMYDDEMDPGHRISAAKELLNRGVGTAANVEIVEKHLKVDLSFSDDKIKQLPTEKLHTLMHEIGNLIHGDAEDAEIIEHKP